MPTQTHAAILQGQDHNKKESQWEDKVLRDAISQANAVHDLLFQNHFFMVHHCTFL